MEKFEIDPRPEIESGQIGFAHHLDEVQIPVEVLREDDDLIRVIILVLVGPSFPGDGKLYSDNGFHSCFLRVFVEFESAVEVSCIGKGHCRHAKFLCLEGKLFRRAEPLEKGIVGVRMEVYEAHGNAREFIADSVAIKSDFEIRFS